MVSERVGEEMQFNPWYPGQGGIPDSDLFHQIHQGLCCWSSYSASQAQSHLICNQILVGAVFAVKMKA